MPWLIIFSAKFAMTLILSDSERISFGNKKIGIGVKGMALILSDSAQKATIYTVAKIK
jgi:hypothetical protein